MADPWKAWRTKNRIPTFPSHLATTIPIFHSPDAAAYGHPCAASHTASQPQDCTFNPNRKELFLGLLCLRFSGSSCIGNESRFQRAHSDDVDQSFRFDADQIGAKRRRALSV